MAPLRRDRRAVVSGVDINEGKHAVKQIISECILGQ